MATMNLSMPDEMKDFVEQQVRARGFMSASEYFRALVRHEQDLSVMRTLIDQGLEAPLPIEEADDAFFASLQARIDAKV